MLGALAVHDGGGPVDLGTPKTRALLAVLLTRPNRPLTVATLIDALWPDGPPRTAAKNLQAYVHHLRRELGADRISRQGPAYLLHVDPGELDADRFAALVAAAGGAPEASAVTLYGQALDLWRGEPFADLPGLPVVEAHARRLTEARRAARERMIDLESRVVFGSRAEAHAWFDSELANMLAVIDHAAHHGPVEYSWRLTATLLDHFRHRQYLTEWLSAGHTASAAAHREGDRAAAAEMDICMGIAYTVAGDLDRGLRHFDDAGRAFDRLGDRTAAARARNGAGIVHATSGRTERARQCFRAAVADGQAADDRESTARYLMNLCNLEYQVGDLVDALEHYRQVLDMPYANIHLVHLNVGQLCVETGDLDRATDHLQRGMAIATTLGDRLSAAQFRVALARASNECGDLPAAQAHLAMAETLAGDVREPGLRDSIHSAQCEVRLAAGEPDRAQEYAEQHVATIATYGGVRYEILALQVLADVYTATGRTADAVAHARRSLDLALDSGQRGQQTYGWVTLAEADLARGHFATAADSAEKAQALCRQTGQLPLRARALRVLGECRWATDEPDLARECWRQATELLAGTTAGASTRRALASLPHSSDGAPIRDISGTIRRCEITSGNFACSHRCIGATPIDTVEQSAPRRPGRAAREGTSVREGGRAM